ncbi:unnamed protein product [Thlaspi arvense]|uniref:Defensin-like domain-containing protein n=1 Tax=Thlaspi arvense TaxID=13288 RepID=A0AAU9RU28_THLAR|nr:unnamed protein product [Thlaspi arvense]
MGSFKFMIIFTLIVVAAISDDIFSGLAIETGIRVQALTQDCVQECIGKFLTPQCYKHCIGLSYRYGACVLSERLPPEISTYRCCCE